MLFQANTIGALVDMLLDNVSTDEDSALLISCLRATSDEAHNLAEKYMPRVRRVTELLEEEDI
jgi:hypothetical protein